MYSSFQFTRLENAHTRTHVVLAWVRVKYRAVILGSLAEAWHCSREYRVQRSRLPGASSHTNPSPRFKPRSILALVYVRLSFSSSRFPYVTTYSLPMLHRRFFFSPSQSLLLSFSLNLFLFSASLFVSYLFGSWSSRVLFIRFYLCSIFVPIFRSCIIIFNSLYF